MRLIADLETDNFLPEMTKIHCIAVMNADNPSETWVYKYDQIDEAIEQLSQAEELIFHNGIAFDIPAIRKIYPNFSINNIKITDTLVLSRLIYADQKTKDAEVERFPKKLFGSHSLKAWGVRLGVSKGNFGETTDWSEWSQEMQDYCEQDVVVTHALWQHLQPENWSQESIEFEHSVAELCDRIGNAGWTFNVEKALALYAKLSDERSKINEELQSLFPSWEIEEEFVPKRNNSTRGYLEGIPFIKRKMVNFNPNSRHHIEFCLRSKYNWKPKEFTPSGAAKIDESVLSELVYPEAKELARSFLIQKRIGMLAEGRNAWLKLVGKDGLIRHVINPNGAVTGRASSFNPNLQQVPASRSEYGKDCRSLFGVPEGYKLVGADLAGIELRCLAEFLPDGGRYADIILQGDVHQANADAAGISRDQAKTMIYALAYSAGDARLGSILGAGAKEGRKLRDNFFRANPSFPRLLNKLRRVVETRGYLIGLDGRRLTVRGHAHLNVLLQSAAALIAKKWIELTDQELKRQGLDAKIIAWIHDEIQIQVRGDADGAGDIAVRMAKEAGAFFKFKIPIDAEYSIGTNWAETH